MKRHRIYRLFILSCCVCSAVELTCTPAHVGCFFTFGGLACIKHTGLRYVHAHARTCIYRPLRVASTVVTRNVWVFEVMHNKKICTFRSFSQSFSCCLRCALLSSARFSTFIPPDNDRFNARITSAYSTHSNTIVRYDVTLKSYENYKNNR